MALQKGKAMFVTRLQWDNWEGMHDMGGTLIHPTLKQIDKAIQGLNGQQNTMVILSSDSGAFLGIGGGNDGHYVVSVTCDPDTIYTVIRQAGSDESSVRLVTGKQEANYPAAESVDLETALQAARSFSIDGTLQPSLQWRRD